MSAKRTTLQVLGAVVILLVSFLSTLKLLDYRDGVELSGSQRSVGIQNRDPGLVVNTGADKDDLGWPNCTMRVLIPASAVMAGGTGVTVKFSAGSSRGLHIVEAFIGNPLLPNRANFETLPRRLLFNGAREVTIAPGGSVENDELNDFDVERGKALLVSYYVDAKGDDPVAKAPALGWFSFFKCNSKCRLECALESEAAEVQVSGYENRGARFVSHGVSEIRVRLTK